MTSIDKTSLSILSRLKYLSCSRLLKLFSLILLTYPFAQATTALANPPQYRAIEQENLIYLQLDTGMVLIELAPFMAPNYVEQFKALVQEGYYDGLDFYRVIDGFVAQAGDLSETKISPWNKPAKDELSRKVLPTSDFYSAQSPDFLTDETGYIRGFPAGRDNDASEEWLLHCYGTVALAREIALNTGTTHFYITIGQAPRALDRNLTVFGRVVYGMDKVQQIKRPNFGTGDIIENPSQRTKIINATLGQDVSPDSQIHLIQDTVNSDAFQSRLKDVRHRPNDFFKHKGNGNLDVCLYRPAIKLAIQANSGEENQ